MSNSRPLVPVKGHPGIYKRGKGYVVRFRDPSGKSRKRMAKTLAQARSIQAEVKADIVRGEFRNSSRLTLKEYAETWKTTFTGRTSGGIRPDTLKRYVADLDAVIIPLLGHLRLSEVEPQHLKQFVSRQVEKGLSTSRVRNLYAPLRALLRTAVEEGLIRYDPTAGVRVTRVHSGSVEEKPVGTATAYTDVELLALLSQVPDEWKLFVRFLAQTGLRISEAIALRWEDLDLGTGRVHVRRRLYRGSFGPPKTRYGRRAVPLAKDLASDLWNHRKTATAALDTSPVFPTAAGGHLDYQNVYSRVLAPAQKRAGVKTGAHVLRHTCATNLFKAGFNAKQVQMWMGHHSPAFTLATYVHLLPEDLPEAPSLPSEPPVVGQDDGELGVSESTERGKSAA